MHFFDMKQNRRNQILELLTQYKTMEVSELSSLLKVSQVTIRKDLDTLEKSGLIKRNHGYASINNTDDINGRLAYHYQEKTAIALQASKLVKNGDTILIESGSCCALLATTLAQTLDTLTIITNSVYIANTLRSSPFNIVLLGGIYQKDSQCLIGPLIQEAIQNFNVTYFFIGADGYSDRTGFTNKDQMRAQAVKDMAQAASTIVVLTESEKFLSAGTIPMHFKNKTQIVITDTNLSNTTKQSLDNHQIQYIQVKGTI